MPVSVIMVSVVIEPNSAAFSIVNETLCLGSIAQGKRGAVT